MFKRWMSICIGCMMMLSTSAFAADLDVEWENAMKEADTILQKQKMGKLSQFVKFDKKFINNLKTIQGVINDIDKELKQVKKIDDIKKTERIKKAFEIQLKKEFSMENWDFYNTAAMKIKGDNFEKVYLDYKIGESAPNINIGSVTVKEWNECKEDGFKGKRCKKAFKSAYIEVQNNLADTFTRFKGDGDVRKSLVEEKVLSVRKTVLDTAVDYQKVLLPEQAPDAKKVIVSTLENIKTAVNDLKQLR